MKDQFFFDVQEEYVVSQDISNPDSCLEKLLADFSEDSVICDKLEIIKSLSHAEKVAWLLDLETKDSRDIVSKMQVASGCVIVVISVTVAVIVGYEIINGVKKALTEKKQTEKEVLKCAKNKKSTQE